MKSLKDLSLRVNLPLKEVFVPASFALPSVWQLTNDRVQNYPRISLTRLDNTTSFARINSRAKWVHTYHTYNTLLFARYQFRHLHWRESHVVRLHDKTVKRVVFNILFRFKKILNEKTFDLETVETAVYAYILCLRQRPSYITASWTTTVNFVWCTPCKNQVHFLPNA